MAAPQDDSEQVELHKLRAQDGIRRMVRQSGERLSAAAHPTTMALLCAAACAPVAATAIGAGASVSAVIGVIGGVGGNILAQTVEKLVRRLERNQPDSHPTEEQIATAIEAGIAEILTSDESQAREVELGIASLLFAVDGAQIALDEAIKSGNRELANLIIGSTERLETTIVETLADHHAEAGAELRDNTLLTQMVLSGVRQMINLLQERTVYEAVRHRSESSWEGRNPYRGLEPFRREHAPVYFGRSQLTAALIMSVKQRFIAGEILMVTGASGSGKSSLLQAGMMEAFEQGAVPIEGSDQWPRCVIRPTYPESDPFANLASAIAGIAGRDPDEIERALREHPARAGRLVLSSLRALNDDGTSTRLVLVVDQFEELLTAAINQEARQAFVTALAAMASHSQEPPALVALGMRGDFIDRCAEFDLLRPTLAHQFIVGRMRRDEMREAIVGPARVAGLQIESDLVETILDDARNANGQAEFGTGALPLLSESMRRLWEEQRRQPHGTIRGLTRTAYTQSGRVADAVAKTADEVLETLGDHQLALAKPLFLHLLKITPDGVAREPRLRSDLESSLGREVGPVIDAFVDGRLLVTDESEVDEDETRKREANSGPTVEIAHECLFWQWSTLNSWIEEDRTYLAKRSKLINDAAEWKSNERDPSFLYQGIKLTEIRHEADEVWTGNPLRFPKLDDIAEEFLDASNDQAAHRQRRRKLTVVGLSALLVLALIAGFATYAANQEAAEAAQALSDRQKRELSLELAEASAEAGLTDGPLAQLLAAAAWETAETDQAWAAMTNAAGNTATGMLTAGHDGPVLAADFSADGSILATGGNDGSLAVWDTATWEAVQLNFAWETGINELEISPDGQYLAFGAWSNVSGQEDIVVLNRSDESTVTLEADFADGSILAFSPDGSMLAGSSEGQTKVWELATGELLATLDSGHDSISLVAFAGPDDEILSEEEDEDLKLVFDPVSNSESDALIMAEQGIQSSEIDEKSRFIIVTCESVCAIRPASGNSEPDVKALDIPFGAVFTGDGAWMAAANSTSTFVEVQEVDTGIVSGVLASSSLIDEIAISPDARLVVAATEDGLQTWDLDRSTSRSFVFPGQVINDFGLSPDGTTLTVVNNGLTQIWDISGTPNLEQEYENDTQGWPSFSIVDSEGDVVATRLDAEGTRIKIWNPLTGETIREVEDAGALVFAMGFDFEGRLVSVHRTEGNDGAASTGMTIWNIETGEKETQLEWEGDPAAVAMDFSPDRSQVATSDGIGNIQIWDVATGDHVESLHGHYPAVDGMAFSPDGSLLAAATERGIAIWDTSSYDQEPTIAMSDSRLNAIEFTPDGTHIVMSEEQSGAYDAGQLVLWDVERELIAAEIPIRDTVFYLRFSDDGSTITADSGIDGVDLHSVNFLTEDPHELVCDQAGRELTEAEKDLYLADLSTDAKKICEGS
jgi:WD40 repeat protein